MPDGHEAPRPSPQTEPAQKFEDISYTPKETLQVLYDDLDALRSNPQILVEAGLIAGDSLEDWWAQTQKEKGSYASYDMGKLVGTLESRLLTRGGLTLVDTPERLEPAPHLQREQALFSVTLKEPSSS